MGIKVCSSAQVMPYSVVGAVQYSPTMRILAVKTALVLMIPLFLALPLVCQGLITHSADATDGVESSMEQKAKVRLPNQVYTIRLSPSSRFAGAMQVGEKNDECFTLYVTRSVAVVSLKTSLLSPIGTSRA